MNRVLGICVVWLASTAIVHADDIDSIEDFALAANRDAALLQLIPGTEDYYYYHCLHLQNTGQLDQVDPLVTAWVKRKGNSQRLREIRHRQALLTYPTGPAKTLDYLRRELGLRFDHRREVEGEKTDLPTRLDPRLLDRQALRQRALARHKNLQGFETRALDGLVSARLDAVQRRHLLERLERPDHAGLARLIVEDLRERSSRGFGSLAIHSQLLRSQLDECLTLMPNLIEHSNFVNVMLSKLRPGNDVDWTQDRAVRRATLERMWNFVQRLTPLFNSLKVHILYRLLELDWAQGRIDRDRFLTYLALPRLVRYIDSEFLKGESDRRRVADLGADFQGTTQLGRVGQDEALVRSFFEHFFLTEDSTSAFEPFIDDAYLKQLFAETKILSGQGDAERWAALLPPQRFQALKERVDLRFEPTNRVRFTAEEPVSLDLQIKNVSTLIVKIFEINTQNYYRTQQRPVDTDINLDGLVPNQELTFDYDDLPLRRFPRHFEFPSLDAAGVYVIDFIGNGQSSRALIRKGDLKFVSEVGPAGHRFTVFDEQNRRVPNARLWIAGREYGPDSDGILRVPFSTRPTRAQRVVVSQGEFSILDTFAHEAEEYALEAGIHVDRESLIEGEKARVVIRPTLSLAGLPVSLSLLEDVRLLITSINLEGVVATKEISDFPLYEDRESVHELPVPPRLASLTFALRAQVRVISRNQDVDLQVERHFALNGIDRTDKVEGLFLATSEAGTVVELLGKNGEPWPHRPLHLSIKHEDFTETFDLVLQTDVQGHVNLGRLDDITWVRADTRSGSTHTWELLTDEHTRRDSIHASTSETIEIPYFGSTQPTRRELSLLEVRGDTFVTDRFDSLAIADGMIELRDLPPGDYDLLVKDVGHRTRLRIAAGDERQGHVLGSHRQLELRGRRPLQIAEVVTEADALVVHLRNATRFSRVHVFADRFHPAYRPYGNLAIGDVEPDQIRRVRSDSTYLEGRQIGDEYRYIIDRKYAQKYPGNMLERPSLLLNPWPVRTTDTGDQQAEGGEAFGGRGGASGRFGGRARKSAGPGGTRPDDSSNLDFLGEAAAVALNLRPDADGIVRIPRAGLGAHSEIHLLAIEPLGTAYRRVTLDETPMSRRDRRLPSSLDPTQHFSQQKKITVLREQEQLVLRDVSTSTIEAYDSLASVFGYYQALTQNQTLSEFAFLLDWPNLSEEEKRAKYSEHACHELSFFLFQKDPEFFVQVIRPYLGNKKDKTFLDAWLVGADLTGYVRPWHYSQLNALERILLSQRIPGRSSATAREMSDLTELIPPDIGRREQLFQTALFRNALEDSDDFGLERAKNKANIEDRRKLLEDEKEVASKRAKPAPTDGPTGPTTPGAAARPSTGKAQTRDAVNEALAELEEVMEEPDADADGFFDREGLARQEQQQLYLPAEKTREWAENNYYHLPMEETTPGRIRANAFWRDLAAHDGSTPFFSEHFIAASENFSEMILALAVLDLPFEAGQHESSVDERTLSLTAATPLILFHQEIEPVTSDATDGSILVSQNFYRQGERYRQVGSEKRDNYVTEEFLAGVVYGCQVVVTNLTSSPRTLQVLLQTPRGSLPVLGGFATRSVDLALQPYRTETIDLFFYFPNAGSYSHYPVHVSDDGSLLAAAEPFTFNVVDELQNFDRESWNYLSQNGTSEEVLAFLDRTNLYQIDLTRIAFRMKDSGFFQKTIALLNERHVYDQTLWSYGLSHHEIPAIQEVLRHADNFVVQCGAALASPLLSIDPVERKTYQHLDYRPLINARAHQLGRRREIVNDRFYGQYHRLLRILSCRAELDDADRMAVVYYLLLQDRIAEALDQFERVDPDRLETSLQYDYFVAYLDFFTPDLDRARDRVTKYQEYPVDHWRDAFAQIGAQLAEIDGAATLVTDRDDRVETQTKRADTAPTFDFTVEAKTIAIDHRNIDQLQVAYYLMDIELLFSRNPFVQQFSGQFSYIRPNRADRLTLADDQDHRDLALPASLHNSNVLVEITGGGQTRSRAYFSNSLKIEMSEGYGQLRVLDAEAGRALSTVYVKVYARMGNGEIKFFKDGYTDRRGRFDYASLSTDDLDRVERFAILILSETNGATVREAAPPAQ